MRPDLIATGNHPALRQLLELEPADEDLPLKENVFRGNYFVGGDMGVVDIDELAEGEAK